MLKYCIVITLFLILGLSCSNPKPKHNSILKSVSNDSLYTLVVAQHDSVMPKTNLMSAQQRALQKQLPNSSQPQKDSILNILSTLKQGQDDMMTWMNGFKNIDIDQEHYTAITESQIRDYLLQEQTKIQQVATLMLKGIAQAEQILK
jgi:hypothetical protein